MEELIKFIKKKAFLVCIIALTLIVLVYSAIIYINWDKSPQDREQVEVSLPVLDLGGYSTLSKQYKEVKIKR